MPNRRHLIALGLALPLSLGLPAARAAAIEGLSFDDRVRVGGQDLRLNGVGLRAVAWLKGYAAALYLPQPTRDAGRAVAAEGAKRMRIRMMLQVPAEEFVKAFHKGVGRNVEPARQPALAERMARFDGLMREIGQVRAGDVVDLDFLPASGLQLSLNGRARGAPIPGDDLYAAVLLVFLGERPVDARLKAGLLTGAG